MVIFHFIGCILTKRNGQNRIQFQGMKLEKRVFLFVMCIFNTFVMEAQKKCDFQIDTASILTNKNLDFFLTELKTGRFEVANKRNHIPAFIKRELNCLAHGFRIANPNKPYNATDAVIRRLAMRQLRFLAISKSLFVLYYLKGGLGLSGHILLVRFDKEKIIDLWNGDCSMEIKSVEDLIGYIEVNRNKENVLNTDRICF
jgi:hypothetical protein